MRRRHEGWPSLWGALFGLLLSMAAMLPHVTFALAAGGTLHCPPQNHASHDMAAAQDRRESMPHSLPVQLTPMQVCCGLLGTDAGAAVPVIVSFTADADYEALPVPVFASLAIPPEPRPPRS